MISLLGLSSGAAPPHPATLTCGPRELQAEISLGQEASTALGPDTHHLLLLSVLLPSKPPHTNNKKWLEEQCEVMRTKTTSD